jgi:hypothetical protein
MLEEGFQLARNREAASALTALSTRTGSGPNSEAYSAVVTVRPEVSSAARPPGLRALRPKVR